MEAAVKMNEMVWDVNSGGSTVLKVAIYDFTVKVCVGLQLWFKNPNQTAAERG